MRQLLLNGSTGQITVEDVPAPMRDAASLLVATRFSVISAGTERSMVELGHASLLAKARARPDLAKKVLESARTEGVGSAYAKVRGRLQQPNPLGYSLSGVVLEACPGAPASPGQRVACAGAGFASHAEVVAVPRNLCARVPEKVSLDDAAYATIAAIALHGVRLSQPELGHVAAVVGLGVVGQLALELLRAAGCVALGLDPDPARVQVARDEAFFATTEPAELEEECRRLTERRGADGVVVAAASRTAAPLEAAVAAARERAVVSIVGDVPVHASRRDMFKKELRLLVSRSYGPGRYDPGYELQGHDYPASYVRWTEGRNLAEVLRLMATGQLRPSRLTTHTFELGDGAEAYALLEGDEPSLGIVLRYPERSDGAVRSVRIEPRRRTVPRAVTRARPRIGVIGAGTFARTVLLPALRHHADIAAVATATAASARATAARFGAELATTHAEAVIGADDLDAVLIATRHDTHAEYAAAALRAGKHVFVEKPLALNANELGAVEAAAAEASRVLMVGFNRRFAPYAHRLQEALGGHGPVLVSCRVNAGRLARSRWELAPAIGGGRIVGEGCHFVDLACFLTGSTPVQVTATALSGASELPEDCTAAMLRFADGSVAQIVYSALGDASLAKERVEVLSELGAGVLDDFRELRLHRNGREDVMSGRRDKGHRAELETWIRACREGRQPWPVAEMVTVMRATFAWRDAVGSLSSVSV